MGYDYLKQVEYLNSLGLVGKNGQKIQYYDAFYEMDNAFIFEEPFQFFQFYVDKELQIYNYERTIVVFIHELGINALASKKPSLIGINAGTIIQMSELFRSINYDILIKDKLNNFDILDKLGKDRFLRKMYLNCLMFTFFHELGHIIQDDLNGISQFSEMVDCGAYSKEVHLMEYDADQFAAIMISVHINDFMEKLEDEDKKRFYRKDVAEMLLSTAMGAIFVNYLIFQSNKFEFYTESCSHPHPSIRATYILNTIVDAFKSGNKGGFDIDQELVIENAFLLAERVIKDAHTRGVIFKNGDEFSRFFEIWNSNQPAIITYFNSLQAMAVETEGLAVKKYLNRFN